MVLSRWGGTLCSAGAAMVVQVVQAVNKEERLREVEQRSQDSYHKRQDSRAFCSSSFPMRTVQDEAQEPVWLPHLFNPGSSSSSAVWSLPQLGCPWQVPAVAPADVGAAPCLCAPACQCSAHPFLPFWQGCCLSAPMRVRNGLALSRAGSQVPQSVWGSSSVPSSSQAD